MEELHKLITSKQSTVETLEAKKHVLQDGMENPRVINENSEQIEEAKRTVSLLCDAAQLAEEKGSGGSAKEILEGILSELEDMKEQIQEHLGEREQEHSRKLSELDKDIETIENVISEDINEPSPAQEEQDQDENMPDFSDFDDF